VYGVLDLESGSFSYARAGHPDPLLLDCEHRPVRIAAQSGRPLGLSYKAILDEQTIIIPPGGTLLIFSDGLCETVESRAEAMEVSTLSALLLNSQATSAQALCQALWRVAGDEAPGNPPISDDFTVIAVQRRATPFIPV
jgi:serine phosphatase RsbU (regulator of sigma subunit)